jgi:hypothetical protein
VVRVIGLMLVVGCGGAPTAPPPKVERPPPLEQVTPEARLEVTVEMSPMSVVSTGTRLVWTDQAGAIWTMPATGGDKQQLSDQKRPDFAFSLLLAGDTVLATSRHGVLRVALPAGPVTKLDISGLPDQPEDSVADAGYMYLTIFKRDDVVRVPIGGGKAEKLATISRGVLGLHDKTLYIASYSQGTLSALPVTGGTPRVIARGLPRPTAVAADATHAYVYCERDRKLRKIDVVTGESIMLATDLINSDDVVVDGDWVYTRSWGASHSLLRIPKAGGPPQTVVDGLRSPYRIAIDARAIYVTSRDDRRIVRIPKATLSR